MRLQVRGQQCGWTSEMRRHFERRMRLALRRFRPGVGLVTADIGDSRQAPDGPLGACLNAVRLSPGRIVLAQQSHNDTAYAIDQAAECAGRAMGRTLGRERGWELDPGQLRAAIGRRL